jgi:hypothetical protein
MSTEIDLPRLARALGGEVRKDKVTAQGQDTHQSIAA